jgi:hypothetical protein
MANGKMPAGLRPKKRKSSELAVALQRKAGASLTLEDRSPAAKLPRSPPAP